MKMTRTQTHVKNFRPSYLILTGKPESRPQLAWFGNALRKNAKSMACFAEVIVGDYETKMKDVDPKELRGFLKSGTPRMPEDSPPVKGFYNAVVASDMRKGVQSLVQLVGVGNLKPNVMLAGMKSDWKESKAEDVKN